MACRTGIKEEGTGRGFTLIELLVAMAILAVIVVAVTQLYEQSTVAWDSGWRQAESMMIGRTLVDFVAREASHAVWDATTGTPSGPEFFKLRGTNGFLCIKYELSGGLKRTVEDVITKKRNTAFLIENTPGQMEIKEFSLAFLPAGDPAYASVYVKVETKDKNRGQERIFTANAPLLNRRRYKYD